MGYFLNLQTLFQLPYLLSIPFMGYNNSFGMLVMQEILNFQFPLWDT